jgi:hypothetical protein
MRIVDKVVLSLQEKEVLYWNTEYPEKLSFQTIDCFDLYCLSKTKHYLLIDEANKIKGWAFTFRDDEDWFAIRVDKIVKEVVKVLY